MTSPLIVVVDDRATNREIFTRLAAAIDVGVVVKAFSDPIAALRWIDTNTPDLVITDIKMPGLTGVAFISRLREAHDDADLPVIAITAFEDRVLRLKALEAGATDFLQSPVDHQEFITRARNLLRLSLQQKVIRSRADTLTRELVASEQSRETAIRTSTSRLAEVIDTIPAVISAVDDDGNCVFVNSYGARLGPSAGTSASDLVRNAELRRTGEPVPPYEEMVTGREGERRTMLTSKYPLRDAEGRVAMVLTTSFDITDQKRAEDAMKQLAHNDALTGLPNRLMLHKLIAHELSGPNVVDRPFALLFIDLDRFKGINDVFGHDHGDALLKEVAHRLRRSVRRGDVVARLGGDEFAILQTCVGSQVEAVALANRVIAALIAPQSIEQRIVHVGASIGITLSPRDGSTVEELLKNADLAMYDAKVKGRNRAELFEQQLQVAARDTVMVEMDLRESLDRGDFLLHYQPQVNSVSGRLIGAEALLRWRRPGQGIVFPGSFLFVAETTGLLGQIERWVIGEACRQAAVWARAKSPVRVAVNVSSSLFRTTNVRELVEQMLGETGLDPTLLELELTETTLLENQREAAAELHALRRLGVSIAVDDFGTGFSSLAYLRMLPVDRLKIDQSFVQGLGSEPGDTAIVRAIVGIGRSLSLEVMAEGVETADQLNRLHNEGCMSVQGHFFGQAVAADDFALHLASGKTFSMVP